MNEKAKKVRTLDVSKLSETMRKLNPQLYTEAIDDSKANYQQFAKSGAAPKKAGKRRSVMNKTEARFARLLEARVTRGEIRSFEYEGLTLRWPDGMRFTADFFVTVYACPPMGDEYPPRVELALIEIKGSRAWHGQEKSIVKFRAARDKWGHLFEFQFFQEIGGEWKETR